MASITGRALHHVFKIGNRKATMDFYRKILGMKVSDKIFVQFHVIVCCNVIRTSSVD